MIDTGRKLRVFLWYSSKDRHIIERFYQRLVIKSWIDLWLDEDRIYPGMNRDVEIERAIETAHVVIACLSHNSVAQEGYIQRELKLVSDAALEKPEGSVFVIPLRLDKCDVPHHIRPLELIDFSAPEDREQAYNRLLRSLQRQADIINKRVGKTTSAHWISSPDFRTLDAQMLTLEASEPQSPDLQLPDIQTQDGETHSFQVAPNESIWLVGGLPFLRITKGKFIIGSKASNDLAQEDEIPQCPCAIPYDYWISRFPVSNEQFSEFAFSTNYIATLPKDWRKKLNHPIVNVSWHDAISYARWLNLVFGGEIPSNMVFRLPTEAEWERASRGDEAFKWPWGNESLDKLLASEISSPIESVKRRGQRIKSDIEFLRCTLNITDIGSFSTLTDSTFGVADMMGSIVEWTQSLYADYPYDAHDGRENLETEGERVIRGCFTSHKERFSVRSARRAKLAPDTKGSILGFRIVIAPPVL
jgi:formylglycine-generating enzyme required for sulfatase activity